MASIAKKKFEENKKDIEELWKIHEEVAGGGAGRKHGVDVLNRSAIVFITACWESFIEDLLTEAFDFMLANVATADKIPAKVRDNSTKAIFEQKNSLKVWDVADNGWRALVTANKASSLERWLDKFHTPKSDPVDVLYEDALGIKKVGAAWHWKGMGAEAARAKLDSYIVIRGNIAHRTEHDTTVYKSWGSDYLGHVERLVEKTEEAVFEHLKSICGKAPW